VLVSKVFVGHDWAEAHHDVHVEDEAGGRLAVARLPEGIEGVRRFHELVAAHADEPRDVTVATETDRGLFVGALVASGYRVLAVNPLSTSRYRERHSTSGAKSDPGDALAVLSIASTPAQGKTLSRSKIASALRRGGRQRRVDERAIEIQTVLRTEQLEAPPIVAQAMGASVAALVAVITELVTQTNRLEQELADRFEQHPDAKIIRSLPGLGMILGARALGEFGDDPNRYLNAKSRKNYASTSPITKASGKQRVVLARYARNRHLADTCRMWAFAAISTSPGARTFYDQRRANGDTHNRALRALANHLVGILHGCLRHGNLYDEHTAWGHRINLAA
jgi:transposase